MRWRHHVYTSLLMAGIAISNQAWAAESAFTTYGLGSAAFGAGVTPPPGTYVSLVSGFYEGEIRGPVTLGGVTLDFGMKVDFFRKQ